jgi:hypothetical protein
MHDLRPSDVAIDRPVRARVGPIARPEAVAAVLTVGCRFVRSCPVSGMSATSLLGADDDRACRVDDVLATRVLLRLGIEESAGDALDGCATLRAPDPGV